MIKCLMLDSELNSISLYLMIGTREVCLFNNHAKSFYGEFYTIFINHLHRNWFLAIHR